MRHKAPCLIFLFTVIRFVTSQYGCFMNEVYMVSVNPCNTCQIRGYCPQSSQPGCDCFPGYLRNSQGICVPPETCDGFYNTNYNIREYAPRQRCGPNEEYTSCGSACPPTCENQQPGACTLQCVSGCFCQRGFVRKDGRCVSPEECNVHASPVPNRVTSKPPVTPITVSPIIGDFEHGSAEKDLHNR